MSGRQLCSVKDCVFVLSFLVVARDAIRYQSLEQRTKVSGDI